MNKFFLFLFPKRRSGEWRCGECFKIYSLIWQLNSRMPTSKQLEPSQKYWCPYCGDKKCVPWQDEDRTITTVEQVYETRWDCMAIPG